MITYLVHVRSLDKVQEGQVQDLSSRRKVEDGRSPGNDSNAPDTSHTKHTLRAIEEAVDAGVGQVLWWRVEKEVAAEPAKLAQRVVDASSCPEVQRDHADA